MAKAGGPGGLCGEDAALTGMTDALNGPQEEAADFLRAIGLPANQDAVDQLARVFVPCLRIICDRDHAGDGSTWRRAGWKPQLHEVFKKMDRLRHREWLHSNGDPACEGTDIINYIGFYLRGRMDKISAWAEWGKPDD